jgi:hypothetical protein
MSDQDDWEFSGADDAKAEIRAAVGYLLRGATGGARGDIVPHRSPTLSPRPIYWTDSSADFERVENFWHGPVC